MSNYLVKRQCYLMINKNDEKNARLVLFIYFNSQEGYNVFYDGSPNLIYLHDLKRMTARQKVYAISRKLPLLSDYLFSLENDGCQKLNKYYDDLELSWGDPRMGNT